MKMYRTLQRNLEELESQIRSIFSEEKGADPDPDPDRGRQLYMAAADEIEQKVAFLKNHITAELPSPDPDHHLSHLSRRFENLHSVFLALNNNLLHGQPLDSPHLDDPSSCSCSDIDDESCCLHERLDDRDGEVDGGPGSFTVYDNPLSLSLDEDENTLKQEEEEEEEEDEEEEEEEEEEEDGDDSNDAKGELIYDGVKEEEEEVEESIEKVAWWCHWRPMMIGVVAGGVTVAATLVSLVIRYGLECRFGDYTHISVFPTPT